MRVPTGLAAELKHWVDEEWTTVNDVMVSAIKKYVAKMRRKHGRPTGENAESSQSGQVTDEFTVTSTGTNLVADDSRKTSQRMQVGDAVSIDGRAPTPAPARARDFSSSGSSVSSALESQDPDGVGEGDDSGNGQDYAATNGNKAEPTWRMKFNDEELAFIDVGYPHWPSSGPLAKLEELDIAYMIRSAFGANPKCDPVDVVTELRMQVDEFVEGKRKRMTTAKFKSWAQKRIRTNASNAKERTAKQEARIAAAIEANRRVHDDFDDDPLKPRSDW